MRSLTIHRTFDIINFKSSSGTTTASKCCNFPSNAQGYHIRIWNINQFKRLKIENSLCLNKDKFDNLSDWNLFILHYFWFLYKNVYFWFCDQNFNTNILNNFSIKQTKIASEITNSDISVKHSPTWRETLLSHLKSELNRCQTNICHELRSSQKFESMRIHYFNSIQ